MSFLSEMVKKLPSPSAVITGQTTLSLQDLAGALTATAAGSADKVVDRALTESPAPDVASRAATPGAFSFSVAPSSAALPLLAVGAVLAVYLLLKRR